MRKTCRHLLDGHHHDGINRRRVPLFLCYYKKKKQQSLRERQEGKTQSKAKVVGECQTKEERRNHSAEKEGKKKGKKILPRKNITKLFIQKIIFKIIREDEEKVENCSTRRFGFVFKYT